MKTLSAFILTVLIIMNYQCFSQTDTEYKHQLLMAYNDSVIRASTKAIEQNPKSHKEYLVRGKAYYKVEDYDKALADFTKVIELEPKNADAYYYRAKIYLYLLQNDLDNVYKYTGNKTYRED